MVGKRIWFFHDGCWYPILPTFLMVSLMNVNGMTWWYDSYIHIEFHRLNGWLSKDMGIYFFSSTWGSLQQFVDAYLNVVTVRKPTVGSFKTNHLGWEQGSHFCWSYQLQVLCPFFRDRAGGRNLWGSRRERLYRCETWISEGEYFRRLGQ